MSETFLIVEKIFSKAPPRNRLTIKFRSSAAFEKLTTVAAREAS
jgi:hypothetical protein